MVDKCYIVQTEDTYEVFVNEKESEKFLHNNIHSLWIGSIEIDLDGYITEMNLQDVSAEEVCSLIRLAISFIRDTNETCDTFYRID